MKKVFVLCVLVFGGCAMFSSDSSVVTNFEECEEAGYDVMESYPRQCVAPEGEVFVELDGLDGILPGNIEGLEEKEVSSKCDFSKDVELRKTEKYGIFGDDEFDTVVCGYFSYEKEEIFGEEIDVAYFNILGFADEGFEKSIQNGIEEGNTVNAAHSGVYKWNLGCYEDEGIKGSEFDKGVPYMSDLTEAVILASTEEEPVSLIFSFGLHDGSGCNCCNLAHQIQLY